MGATLHTGTTVTALTRGAGGAVTGVVTDRGTVRASWVLNAAGTWGGEFARFAGVHLPVLPRRGFVLVTEPLPRLIRHKVYAADYVANVASGSAAAPVFGGGRGHGGRAGADRGEPGAGRIRPDVLP